MSTRLSVAGLLPALLIASVITCASCDSTPTLGFAVALTLQFDSSIDDATLASIAALAITTTGDESYEHLVPLSRPLGRIERIVYRPSAASRSIEVAVSAANTKLTRVSHGDSGLLALVAGKSTDASVIMRTTDAALDAGVDQADDAADLNNPPPGSDLSPQLPYSQLVLSDNPLAYYRLDETTGATAKDSATAHVNGTYVGAVTLNQPGALGSDSNPAIQLTPAAAVVVSSTEFNFTGVSAYSLEVWIKATATAPGNNCFIFNNDFYEPVNKRQDYNLFLDANRILHFERWVNGGIIAIGSSPITLGQYIHVVVVYDGAQMIMYVNGAQASSNPAAQMAAAQGGKLVIGAGDDQGSSGFIGNIDEPAVYAYALSAAKVLSHYNAGVAK